MEFLGENDGANQQGSVALTNMHNFFVKLGRSWSGNVLCQFDVMVKFHIQPLTNRFKIKGIRF